MYHGHPYPNASATLQGGIEGSSISTVHARLLAEQSKKEINRVPQVPEAITRLNACVEDLGSAVNALAARIDPVLRPVDHTAAGHGAAVPTPVRCHAASQIDEQCDRLCYIAANLRDILDRLEV